MTLQKRQQIKSWRETRETICNSASDWSMGKTVKKIKMFFISFLFSSLFFHRPIRSQVAQLLFIVFCLRPTAKLSAEGLETTF
jgi:hypothetical protein